MGRDSICDVTTKMAESKWQTKWTFRGDFSRQNALVSKKKIKDWWSTFGIHSNHIKQICIIFGFTRPLRSCIKLLTHFAYLKTNILRSQGRFFPAIWIPHPLCSGWTRNPALCPRSTNLKPCWPFSFASTWAMTRRPWSDIPLLPCRSCWHSCKRTPSSSFILYSIMTTASPGSRLLRMNLW